MFKKEKMKTWVKINEIIFVFENGFKLEIAMDIADYMSIVEIKL